MLLVDNGHNNVISEKHSKHLNGDDMNQVTRKKKREQVNLNKIQLNNRFSLLDDETNSRINDGNITKVNISQSTPVRAESLTDKSNANDENQSNHQDGHREKITRKFRNITILGDSILKDIKPYKMREAMKSKDKIFIKSFPGATTECMSDYVNPSLKYKPDLMIIHTGTNDLRSDKTPSDITEEIINLIERIKTDENEIIVSGVVVRNDNLNDKGLQVNASLKLKCVKYNVQFLEHYNISSRYHLNASGLHLNPKGTIALAQNFLRCINL